MIHWGQWHSQLEIQTMRGWNSGFNGAKTCQRGSSGDRDIVLCVTVIVVC